MPVVFISYAHESRQFRESVRALADWLSQRGCAVLTDHPYEFCPPAEGWQVWMHGCISQADKVLVACTPKLRVGYEKTAPPPDAGRGSTYEGAIVTQHIYDQAMHNTKFYPVLPDGGAERDIPTTLRPWWNGHWFPSGNERILQLVSGTASDADASDGDSTVSSASMASNPKDSRSSHHHRWAERLLAAEGAAPLREALARELHDEFSENSVPHSAAEIVRFFSHCDAELVQQLFYVVRRALLEPPAPEEAAQARRQSEEAAAALYCIAAGRLVNQAALTAGANPEAPVLSVPCSENVVCAIIATALFGGKLCWAPALESDLPRSEYVFKVTVPAAGDDIFGSFDRAVYAALFPNDRSVPELSLDGGPLSEWQVKKLAARFRAIRNVYRECLALVVSGPLDHAVDQSVAGQHDVPVMFPNNEATSALLGMDAATLLAEIREFWGELQILPQGEGTARDQSVQRAREGVTHVTKPDISIQVTGGSANIALNTGDHSAAQSGSNNTARVAHSVGTVFSELAPLLRDLVAAVAELPSARAREALIVHAQAAEAEVSAKAEPDVGLVKGTLDKISSAAKAIDSGEKVLTLCSKAYKVLAPVLGLPSLPLP